MHLSDMDAARLQSYVKVVSAALPFLPAASPRPFQGSRGFRGRASGAAGARWVNRPVSADAPPVVLSTAAAMGEVEAPIFSRHMSRAPPRLLASERPPRWCVGSRGSVRPAGTEACDPFFYITSTLRASCSPGPYAPIVPLDFSCIVADVLFTAP